MGMKARRRPSWRDPVLRDAAEEYLDIAVFGGGLISKANAAHDRGMARAMEMCGGDEKMAAHLWSLTVENASGSESSRPLRWAELPPVRYGRIGPDITRS